MRQALATISLVSVSLITACALNQDKGSSKKELSITTISRTIFRPIGATRYENGIRIAYGHCMMGAHDIKNIILSPCRKTNRLDDKGATYILFFDSDEDEKPKIIIRIREDGREESLYLRDAI